MTGVDDEARTGAEAAVALITMTLDDTDPDRMATAGILLDLDQGEMISCVAALTSMTRWSLQLVAELVPDFDIPEVIRRFALIVQAADDPEAT